MSSRVLFGLFLAVVAIASVDCNSERDALNVWKHGLVDPSNALQSWNSTLPSPCTWYHITCNSENSVIRVRFYNNRLTGSIPPSLGNLTSLQILELNSNLLTGTVPVEVSNLIQSGTYLNVSDNMLQATADRSNSTSNRANYYCELLLFRINLFVVLIYISLF
ncbi:hypothetical protein FF1_011935 [Malus domestica]